MKMKLNVWIMFLLAQKRVNNLQNPTIFMLLIWIFLGNNRSSNCLIARILTLAVQLWQIGWNLPLKKLRFSVVKNPLKNYPLKLISDKI